MIVVVLAAIVLSTMPAWRRFGATPALIAAVGIAAGTFVSWQSVAPVPSLVLAMAGAAVMLFVADRVSATRASHAPLVVAAVATIMLAAFVIAPAPSAWWRPHLSAALWSTRGGLLATSPMIWFAVAGLVAAHSRQRDLFIAGLVVIAGLVWLVGSGSMWWRDAWPTAAPFVVLMPWLVAGLASFVDLLARLARTRPLLVATAALAPLVAWNLTLMSVAQAGRFRIGEPASFADAGAEQARTLHDWIGHVPSYPANLLYALRSNVRPAAYDYLESHAVLAEPGATYVIDVGRGDERVAVAGWHAQERDGDRTFRWADRRAEFVLPIAEAAPIRVQIALRAFDLPGAPSQRLTLIVNGHAQPPLPVGIEWTVLNVDVPATAWRAGANTITLQFDRATRPSDLGGGDTRALAAAVDEMRLGR